MSKQSRVPIFVHPIHHHFKVGDEVIDNTAERAGWPDVHGVVKAVDGSMVEVEYPSGNTRWKMHISIRKKK